MSCVYIDAIIVLVKCCNSKSQILNKSSFVQQSSIRAFANSTIWYQSEAVRDHVCGVKDSIFGGVHSTRVQSGTVKLVVWD